MAQPRTQRRPPETEDWQATFETGDPSPREYARWYRATYGASPRADHTTREYEQWYAKKYGARRNWFAIVFNLLTFVLMLIVIQAVLFNLFRIDPLAWIMTQVFHNGSVQQAQSVQPTASIRVQSQPPAAVVMPQVQEQPAQPQEQPAAAQPTDVPAAPAQPQEQPSDLQAPVQGQPAPVAPAVPTVAPTAAPKPTSWAPTADSFVVKSDFVKATPDARYTGSWRSLPTH